MFLSKREWRQRGGGTALTGMVTLPGSPAGAWLEGERRGVAVYAPGGYHWVPGLGSEVLVLKAGENGEQPCAVGVPAGGRGLEPGEVLITGGGCSIKLGLDGRVEMSGTVNVTGGLLVNGQPVQLVPEEIEEGT